MPTNLGGGIRIKSIQRIEANSAATSTNVTITAVDTNKATVKLLAIYTTGGTDVETVKLEITNSTTVNISRSGSASQVVVFEVIDYVTIRRITTGTITVNASSGNSVSLDASTVASKCKIDFTYNFIGAIQPLGNINTALSGNTLSFVNTRAQNASVRYYVTEFL